jgi:YD repeat-containing protein
MMMRSLFILHYFEPSGLTKQVNEPLPGTVGSTQTVAYSATYSTLGNLLTLTGPGNNAAQTITTTYNYTQDGTYNQAEALGEPILLTDNLGNSSHLRYNNLGEISSAIDALGNQTSALYYFTGQLEQVILPATGQSGNGQGYTTYSYQYPGGPVSLVSVNDEGNQGVIRQYTPQYGAEGETLGMTGNLNPYSVTYDGAYRPLTLKDGNNNVTQYAYAQAGYLQTLTYPGLDTLQALSWDDDGNVLTAQNGRGMQFSYLYTDNESRLTSAASADDTIQNDYRYDSYGRLQSVGDLAGYRTFTYDDDDLPLTQVFTSAILPQGHNSVTQTYAYYPDSSEQTLTLSCLTAPNNTFTYTYNGRGDLTGLSNPYGETTSWNYYANGWMQTQTLGSGTTTTYTFNPIGQLTDLSNTQGGTVLSDYNSSGAGHYDGAGNLLGLTASLPGAPSSYSGTNAYQYDTHDQLKNERSTREVTPTPSMMTGDDGDGPILPQKPGIGGVYGVSGPSTLWPAG